MTFEERMQKAEEKGYTPVMVVEESMAFFVENGEYQVGATLKDSIGDQFVVKYIGFNKRMEAERLNKM